MSPEASPASALASALAAVRARSDLRPRVAFVLGTGLGGLASELDVDEVIAYADLPGVVVPTVETHGGQLLLGRLEGVPVAVLQGRFHRYEGYSLAEVVFPVRLMKLLGAEALFLSGACGGMNPLWNPGDLVLLDDHLNLMGDNPLIGPNPDEFGPRFPDMSAPYDPQLQALAERVALDEGIRLQRGVYAAVTGPSVETRAEYRMLRTMGADVVGMSTVPEVIAARHAGLRVLAVSIITDQCLPDALTEIDVPTIIATAMEAQPRLTVLFRGVLARMS